MTGAGIAATDIATEKVAAASCSEMKFGPSLFVAGFLFAATQLKTLAQGMKGAGRAELAGVEVKRFHLKRRRHGFAVRVSPMGHRSRRILRAASQCDVRVKGSHIELKPGGEQGVVDSLTQLKQTWMTRARADPQDSWRTIGREGSNSFHGQDEGSNVNGLEPFDHGIDSVGRDVAQETQGDMQLLRASPRHAGQGLCPLRERVTHGGRKREGDEKAFGGHRQSRV